MSWNRVSRTARCPICQHDSWCLVNSDAVLCMRVPCEHSYALKSGETGWIHRLDGKPVGDYTSRKVKEPPTINPTRILATWRNQMEPGWLEQAARNLGVSCASLERLRACWSPDYRAMAFPMYNGTGSIVGIRLRAVDGSKFAVPGSHQGIFLPAMDAQPTVLILEGPTDTAAALTLGYYAIGRPSCSGGSTEIVHAIKRFDIKHAIIIADNDIPGLEGARNLSGCLPIHSCIAVLPCKDLREFIACGGTRDTLDSLLKGFLWSEP